MAVYTKIESQSKPASLFQHPERDVMAPTQSAKFSNEKSSKQSINKQDADATQAGEGGKAIKNIATKETILH